jgi:drug/metabolite transporter (DMT)-like permease
MKSHSSAIDTVPPLLSPPARELAASPGPDSATSPAAGIIWGSVGVLAFSLTLPLTRVAVADLDPLFVAAGRAVVAAVLAIVVLAATRTALPSARQWVRLGVVAAAVVAGFPLLTSFALQTAPAAHGAVVVGLLPATTAVMAVIRVGERPGRRFWIAAACGVVALLVFVVVTSGGLGGLHLSDLLLVGAVLLVAVGYAEGGLLSREIGSWQTICWALVLALPVMAPLTLLSLHGTVPTASPEAWLSFAYLGGVSMFLGFFAWYRGLAIGPMARVSQIQLVQPVISIVWAALLLHETIGWMTLVAALAVIGCAAVAVRSRVSRASRAGHASHVDRVPVVPSPAGEKV